MWIKQLDGNLSHGALLVCDPGVDWSAASECLQIASSVFQRVEIIAINESWQSWPAGPNALFKCAAQFFEARKIAPWLWLEPDAIPLKKGWLDTLQTAYFTAGKPFLGSVMQAIELDMPEQYLPGTAVYPMDAWKRMSPAWREDKAFDVATASVTVPVAANTPLIQHLWGIKGLPPTFIDKKTSESPKNTFTLESINPEAVLFHRNKDGSLLHLLREKAGISGPKKKAKSYPRMDHKGTITIRRSMALGDVLAATCVANKLHEQGWDVNWQSIESCHVITRRVPSISSVSVVNGSCDVDLDGAYEKHAGRRTKSFGEIFQQVANSQLSRRGISIQHLGNYAPIMVVDEAESEEIVSLLKPHPKPWVMICPRSNSHINRTVPDSVWEHAASGINGTKFWLGTNRAPDGIVDLGVRHMDRVIYFLARSDLLVTVDTGPMHIAAALNVPVVAIEQASSPELHLSDQQDFIVVRPPLSCLNCQDLICRFDAGHPPCMDVDPGMIVEAVNRRLNYLDSNFVSAVIPIFKPPAERINKCIQSIINQVDEVIVTVDATGAVPLGIISHPKLTVVRKKTGGNIGVGRNINFGVRHSNGHWILILNDDVFLNPDVVQKLKAEMRFDVGIVSHLLFYPDGTIQHGGKYRNPGDIGGWGHIDHRARQSRYKTSIEQETVCGASMLVRRCVFYEARGFDERFMFYCEDDDFGMKARQAGWKIMFTPHASGIHQEHQSTFQNPMMHQYMKDSCKMFGAKWSWYLENNRFIVPGEF